MVSSVHAPVHHDPVVRDPAVPGDATRGVDRILRAVERHAADRASCVGLVPTENVLSPLARSVMGSDLSHRYLFQNPQWRYVGGKQLSEIEAAAQEIASELFGARFVNVRPPRYGSPSRAGWRLGSRPATPRCRCAHACERPRQRCGRPGRRSSSSATGSRR